MRFGQVPALLGGTVGPMGVLHFVLAGHGSYRAVADLPAMAL